MKDGGVKLEGIFPILATCFNDDQTIDYESQKRLIEFCIEGGVHGLVTLANASEGHLLSDMEKRELVAACLQQIDGRIPLIVSVNHPSTKVASELAAFACDKGAAAVMAMPPFFGRWRSSFGEIEAFFAGIAERTGVPIFLQDHALSDITLSSNDLIHLSNSIESMKYLKMESGNINSKAEGIIKKDHGFASIFGGNSGILFIEEYDVGCRGTMPACYMPQVFRKVWDIIRSGDRQAAIEYFSPYSRLAMFENESVNRCTWKELLKAKGIIKNGRTRAPVDQTLFKTQIENFLGYAGRLGLLQAVDL